MSQVYVVIIEDRHCDVTADVFSDKDKAVEFAIKSAKEYCRFEEGYDDMTLTSDMMQSGWIKNIHYSCEGDSVRVVKTELKEPQDE